jgi:hypothetical protein
VDARAANDAVDVGDNDNDGRRTSAATPERHLLQLTTLHHSPSHQNSQLKQA